MPVLSLYVFLITGGFGFIGSHLTERLLEKDCGIVVDLSKDSPVGSDKLMFVKKDIRSLAPKDLEGIDVVFHLAAVPPVRSSVAKPDRSFDINVAGSFRVLEAAREAGVKKFVFASSGGTVYGEASGTIAEDTPLRPISPYGASKAAFEMYLSAYAHSYGMDCTSLRLANVIGPRSRHGVVWDFFHKLRRNPRELEIFGDGRQEKSYLHVSDVVDAFILAAEKTKGFEAYNVANDGTLTVRRIAELVSEAMGLSPKFKFTGGERGWTGDVRRIVLDSSKLRALGWAPRLSQEEAVLDYLRWLKHNPSSDVL